MHLPALRLAGQCPGNRNTGMKKLIVFDLDGTLAESKAALDVEMAGLLKRLMGIAKVAVISGGGWPQFQKQVLGHLPRESALENLSLLPTCGTQFYRYSSDWKKIYSEDFTAAEKTKIIDALNKAVAESGVTPEKLWGEAIEDRGSQITYSALGQKAPLDGEEMGPRLCETKENCQRLPAS